jgi:hypothetical protein
MMDCTGAQGWEKNANLMDSRQIGSIPGEVNWAQNLGSDLRHQKVKMIFKRF